MSTRSYSTILGFFVQNGAVHKSSTNTEGYPTVLQALLPRFGLINERDDRWTAFIADITRLNATAKPEVQFKVFFLGRHGEGYHNVGFRKYSLEEWWEWAKQDGDGEIVWGPDPRLTPLGEQQAQDARTLWVDERRFGVPLPEKLYTSPLSRAIQTNQITFDDDSLLPSGSKTVIVENLRERGGVHTCDQRRTRSEIHAAFSEYSFEEGFSEKDELWTPEYRETDKDLDRRAKTVLDKIFDGDAEQFISITSHSRLIESFLRICGHRPVFLPTGGILPIVVKETIR